MPKISSSCYTSSCYANYIKNHMQNKDQQKRKRILKTIFTECSRKEKAITRYTRIYIYKKTKWHG